jgi:hypothetical protein
MPPILGWIHNADHSLAKVNVVDLDDVSGNPPGSPRA